MSFSFKPWIWSDGINLRNEVGTSFTLLLLFGFLFCITYIIVPVYTIPIICINLTTMWWNYGLVLIQLVPQPKKLGFWKPGWGHQRNKKRIGIETDRHIYSKLGIRWDLLQKLEPWLRYSTEGGVSSSL